MTVLSDNKIQFHDSQFVRPLEHTRRAGSSIAVSNRGYVKRGSIAKVFRTLRGALVLNVLVIAFNLGSGVLSAKLLGPSGRGAVAAALAIPIELTACFLYARHDGISHLLARGRLRPGAAMAISLRVFVVRGSLVVLASAALISIILGPAWSPAAGLALLVVAASLLSSVLLGLNDRGHGAAIRTSDAATTTLVLIALWFTMRTASPGVVALAFGAGTLFSVGLGLYWAPKHTQRATTEELGSLRGYTRINGDAALWSTMLFRLDYILLPLLSDNRSLGLYVVATSAASVIPVVIGNLAPTLLARLSDPDAKKADAFHAVAVLVPLGLVLMVVLGAAAWLLIPPLYGDEFRRSVLLTLLLLPGTFCVAIATILGAALAANGRSDAVRLSARLAAFASVPTLVLLTIQFGVLGAAIASTLSYFLLFALRIRPLMHLRKPLPTNSPTATIRAPIFGKSAP